jgi:hypothetical protein
MALPTGTAVGPGEIEGVCGVIRLACSGAAAVREKLAGRRGDG